MYRYPFNVKLIQITINSNRTDKQSHFLLLLLLVWTLHKPPKSLANQNEAHNIVSWPDTAVREGLAICFTAEAFPGQPAHGRCEGQAIIKARAKAHHGQPQKHHKQQFLHFCDTTEQNPVIF